MQAITARYINGQRIRATPEIVYHAAQQTERRGMVPQHRMTNGEAAFHYGLGSPKA
jgi:hypothetical protein